jgi:preprotein translocase subunit SecB
MTDVPPDAPADAGQPAEAAPPPGPGIRVLAQFTRDLSFENPRAPDSLRADGPQPQIDLGVEMRARGRSVGLFEIDLKLSTTAVTNGAVSFQLELLYGGLFEVIGATDEILEPLLLIEGPRYLFPYARQIISDATAHGGFPPFMLEPIDFAAVYAAQRAQREGALITTEPLGNA